MNENLTFGPAATRLGVQVYHVEKLANRGVIPFNRAGRFRFVKESDLPKIRKALIEAGYLKDEPATVAASA